MQPTTVSSIETAVSSIRDQASRVHDKAANDIDTVTRNPDLTDDARQRHTEEVGEDARNQLAALRKKEDDLLSDAKLNLQRIMFGSHSGDIVSTRDANDRAKRIEDPDEALEAYEQATIQRDDTLLRAIAQRAVDMGWSSVSDKHFAGKGNAEYLKALEYIETLNSQSASFNRTLSYSYFG